MAVERNPIVEDDMYDGQGGTKLGICSSYIPIRVFPKFLLPDLINLMNKSNVERKLNSENMV